MMNRKQMEDEIARLKAEITRSRAEHDKALQQAQGESDALRKELAQVKDQAVAELQQRHKVYQRDLATLQTQLDTTQKALDDSQNEVRQVRSGMVDINNLRTVIQQLVEPATLEQMIETYKGKFVVTESASSFVLSPLNEAAVLPVTFLLPKYGLRVYRTNGHLADLSRSGVSEKLAKDDGFQHLLPPSLKSQVFTQYVRRRDEGSSFLELATPHTANAVLISCLVENGPETESWCATFTKSLLARERSKKGDNLSTLHFLLDFPGESPSIKLMPGIDVDFTEADLDSCRQERERALREGCHQEYMRHHFSMT